MKKQTTVFLADDHAILRDGLKMIIADEERFDIVGEASDGQEALQQIAELRPDIAIVDISMPLMSGLEVARQVKKYYNEVKVVILTRHDNDLYKQRLGEINVEGYLNKEDASDYLIEALDAVRQGAKYFEGETTFKSGKGLNESTDLEKLSDREIEILKLVAEGKSNVEIAKLLFISEYTVKTHRSNIITKLGTSNLAELTTFAIKNGLVEI